MPDLQMYCAEDDRHRAVLLVNLLDKLGSSCELLTERRRELSSPILVVWTSAAAASPWLRGLFAPAVDAVALTLDPVALPPDCQRAVALTSWPARSADVNMAELARWLQSSSPADSFGRRVVAALNRQAGGRPGSRRDNSATWVLLMLVIMLGGFFWWTYRAGDSAEPREPPTQALRAVPAEPVDRTGPAAGVGGDVPGGDAPGPAGSTLPAGAAEAVITGAEPAHGPADHGADYGAEHGTEYGAEPYTERGHPVGPADDSSLAHLCRAGTVSAALAWYAVLERTERVRAPTLDCVRVLAATPGFEGLSERLRI